MNMIPPYNLKAFHSINEIFHDADDNAAEYSMNNVANEVRELPRSQDELIWGCKAYLDGTWQKRGHVSLNSVTKLQLYTWSGRGGLNISSQARGVTPILPLSDKRK